MVTFFPTMAGIDPDEYNGFAFGLGFDRLVMIRTNLDDIRYLNSNNLKVMSQFKTKMQEEDRYENFN